MIVNLTLVRVDYSERAVWEESIPDDELYTFLIEGESLDAPYAFSAGSTKESNGYVKSSYTYRE